MRLCLPVAVFAALVLAPVSTAERAGVERSRVALSVSPVRLAVAAPASKRITVRNDGPGRVLVDVARRAIGGQRQTKGWLRIAPARLTVLPGRSAVLTLRVRRSPSVEPGRHDVLVLLTSHRRRGSHLTVQLRLGIRVRIHVPGRIVRRLALGGLRVHRAPRARFMFVSVVNRGNVSLPLRGHVTASLIWRRRQVARLSPRVRGSIGPGARTIVLLRYGGHLRGAATAVVQVLLNQRVRVERRYRIRL